MEQQNYSKRLGYVSQLVVRSTYLGAAIGSVQFKETYVKEKEWVKELNELSVLAKTEPQLAYAAYIFGLSERWMYLIRTMEDISHLNQPLENCIKNVFLPSFLQFSFSDSERKLFSLPAKYGGIGVFNPTEICHYEFQSSSSATAPLVKMITDQRIELSPEECHEMDVKIKEVKSCITNTLSLRHQQILSDIKSELPESLQKQVELLCRKGSSSWLPHSHHKNTILC